MSETPELTLPVGWAVVESKSHPGQVYFYNVDSRATKWEMPTETVRPKQVQARHVLVKHNKVRNPFSKPKNAPVTLSREDALVKIKVLQDRINNGEPLEKVAAQESDCSSARRGGDLGLFGRGQMQPPFEKAAFALGINEISGIVESPSGFHIVQRIEPTPQKKR